MNSNREKAALYARVSTENQELDTQEEKLKKWVEKEDVDYDLYSEKASSVKERPKFEQIMENVEEYDYVVVTKIDRFARSIHDFNERMNLLEEAEVEFRATDQPIDTADEMYGDFFRKQLSLLAELERKMIRRRMNEGFRKAEKEGRVGRPPKLDKKQREWAAKQYDDKGSIKVVQALVNQEFDKNISRSTARRALVKEGVIE